MTETQIIDGKKVAARVRERVRAEVAELKKDSGVVPRLAAVLVGDDPASTVYIRNKKTACSEVGIESAGHELSSGVGQKELETLVKDLSDDVGVSGVLVQLPLPEHQDLDPVIELIDPLKDVDGLTVASAGLLTQGREALVPCTPAGVVELLRESSTEIEGSECVILGRSKLVGRPLVSLLLGLNATVTVCHSRTRDLGQVCRRADVLIAAVGSPRLVGADMVKEGATVIDVGINRTAGGLVGDVDFEQVAPKARAITPVPGGVGPMTVAMLLSNTLKAAQIQLVAAQ